MRKTSRLIRPELRAVWPDLAERAKTRLLAADLAARGARGAPVPSADAVSPPELDVAAALGAAYVLEGSTLGGAVLARSVAARIEGAPVGYFTCYGEQIGARWRSFMEVLERAEGLSAGDEEVLVASAVATFGAVEARFAAAGLLR